VPITSSISRWCAASPIIPVRSSRRLSRAKDRIAHRGGRYDELMGLFSNQSLPMTGTSFGIERIIDVMDELAMYPPNVGLTVTQVLVTVFDRELAGPPYGSRRYYVRRD